MNKDELVNLLPHGAGINGSWTVEEKKDAWVAYNFYEPMTEAGFYDGSADFTLVIPKRSPSDFKLSFRGREAQRLNQKHGLREYLEDTFAYSLETMLPEMSKPIAKKSSTKRKSGRQSSAPTSVRGMR